ncbi:hypothetical protein [Algoriphagus sp. CAU 1675]|uniref:hypothetical protein n=1 Tax=Algoriphagus sp. CAU 1675 TaxID=3032597 RepID=UPI0023DBDE6B|nr:hypothetical protein [Algoriphagus sp. CAU 1675]MDF2158752.1 hypothetical protein [Algoriphagus sp. CAU 1675]
MKKALVIFLMGCGLIFSANAQTQNQGDARLHAFGSYGLRWENLGAGAGIEFFFIDHFAVMPSFTKIFPEVGNASNFSFDFRYFVSEGPSQLYFMTGYSQNWENPNKDGGVGVRRTYKGANVGVGAYIRLIDQVGLSTEFRVQSQFPREASFRFGLTFPL